MTRVLAPIREDLAELKEKATKLTTDLNALTDKVTGMDNRLKTVQSSNAQIRRMAAIVGSHCFFLVGCSLINIKWQTWNRSRGSGREARLEVVPFESGDDPTTVCIHCPSVSLFWLIILVSLVFHLFLRLRQCRVFLLPLGICTLKAIIQIHSYLLWQRGFLAFLLQLA